MAKKKGHTRPEEQSIPEEEEEEHKKSDLFTKIDAAARVIIDKYKEERKMKISTIIEDALDIYHMYYSMPPEVRAIIDRHAPAVDDETKVGGIFSNKFKVIEEAINLLEQEKSPLTDEDLDIWCRAKDKMMLIGYTTFDQLIAAAKAGKPSLDKPQQRNNAIDVITWFTGKPMRYLTLEEIFTAIQKMWVVSNYFRSINVEPEQEAKDTFHLIFEHNHDRSYSEYWLGYFDKLFTSEDFPFKCVVEDEDAYEQTLSLTIKVLFDNNR